MVGLHDVFTSSSSRLPLETLSPLPFSCQKLLCEDRFVGGVGVEVEVLEKQLLSQMLEAIRVTPSLHEDLQVEVMKVRPGDGRTRSFGLQS